MNQQMNMVVIGAGGAGLAAAVSAMQSGVENAIFV